MMLKIELKDAVKFCPFENLKEWKTGYSVKCPKSTTVVWVHDNSKANSLYNMVKVKRATTCMYCINKFKEWLLCSRVLY